MSELRKVSILTILFFMIDSVLTSFVPISFTKSSTMIIPCLGFMMFAMNCFVFRKNDCLLYATIAGAFYSVVYAKSLLFYVVIFALIAFLIRKIINFISFTYFEVLLVFISTIFLKEIVVYLFMYATNQTSLGIVEMFINRLIPTITFNILVSWIVYFTHVKVFKIQKWSGNDVYKSEREE